MIKNIFQKNDVKEIIKITNEFLKIPSSISYEQPFLRYMQKKAKKLGYKTILKENNYLIVKPKKENNSKYLFSAHIDRHALIKNKDKNLEYLAFYLRKKQKINFPRDEKEPRENELIKSISKSNKNLKLQTKNNFLIIEQENKPIVKFGLTGGSELFEKAAIRHTRENIISYNFKTGKKLNFYKTIRNSVNLDKKEILFQTNKNLKKEDEIFMFNSKAKIKNEYISGQIDNVISAATLFYLLKTTNFSHEIIFTTQEEIGNSWKCIDEYLKTQKNYKNKLIVLDTSPYPNLEENKSGFLTLRHGDERGGFDKKLVSEIKGFLEKENISFDFKPSFMGNTELGKLAKESKGKVNGATLQLPSMNYHTTYETCTKKSLENYFKIIKLISS